MRVVILVLGLAMLTSSSAAAAHKAPSSGASAFVRVNQVGYPTGASKRAYLMASAVETGATFAVKNSTGATVLSGPVGARLGSWSSGYPNVYAIDFTSLTTAGTYTISVAGPIAAASPTFVVGTGPAVYAGALRNALSYYQNSRDGAGYIPSPLRTAPGHLNDANAMTYSTPSYNAGSGRFSGDLSPLGVRIDGSGGWWDAGDYLKFLQTESYTDGRASVGRPRLPGADGHRARRRRLHGRSQVRRRVRCFACGTTRTRTLYYQVGIGEGNGKTAGDHDIWRLPQADDTLRRVTTRSTATSGTGRCSGRVPPGSLISPNLAGRDAAALAECYSVFKTSDPTLAGQMHHGRRAHLRACQHLLRRATCRR